MLKISKDEEGFWPQPFRALVSALDCPRMNRFFLMSHQNFSWCIMFLLPLSFLCAPELDLSSVQLPLGTGTGSLIPIRSSSPCPANLVPSTSAQISCSPRSPLCPSAGPTPVCRYLSFVEKPKTVDRIPICTSQHPAA